MWNKRDEVPTPRTVEPLRQEPQPISPPSSANREPIAAAPAPRPVAAPAPSAGANAAIGSSMVIVGEIYSREELLVDGEVDGKLELQHRLTVGPNGKVRATIKAREVVVFGNVQGDVEVSD